MEYIWVQGKGEGFDKALAVRVEVFVEEQGYSPESEPDGQDEASLHIVALEEGRPLATARLFETAPGEYHIGRVAVSSLARGKRLGTAVMEKLIKRAWQEGAQCILLGAQYDKTRFYELLGFVKTGERFLDEGYPHDMMRLERTAAEIDK